MSSEIDYLDFEVTVEKADGDQYLVRAQSGKDKVEIQFTNPFSEDKRALIKATTKANLRSSRKVRGASGASEVKQLKSWGAQLFDQAISGEVGKFYEKCRVQAEEQGKGVRWRLALDASIDDLPWEFLCSQDEFLALNPLSPIVRYVPRRARLAPLKESEHPLRLLVVIASPSDEVPLDTDAEKERINAAFESLTAQGLVDLTFIEGPDTWQQLYDELFRNQTHILHFIGHGAFDQDKKEGVLVMEDAERKAKRIESNDLRVLVQGRSRLRLVVLNSCLGTEGDDSQPFSSVAAGLIQSGIPAVIAMQSEISDDAAREIAETFYKSLALNMPVDMAMTEARRKIFLFDRGSLEWATPILYMQARDGQLFQFKERVTGTQSIPGTPPPEPETVPAIAVLVQSGSGREISLRGKTIKIGRGTDNDINVDEAAVSRKHATLTRRGSTYAVENFGGSGTLLNGKPIAQRTNLKHNDVIRVGTTDLKFRLLADFAEEVTGKVDTSVGPARRRSETVTAQPESRESFAEKAARSYEAGVQFMARGNWAEAIAAFNSARTYVPGYEDVEEKLSVCGPRLKVATLYAQARHLCAQKNYDQARQALAEATRLDPDLVDAENIRELSECGQKYLQAIAELQKGNRAGGGALLREVISRRPNFEDAEKRFDDLANGGTGLIAAPPSATVDLFNKGKQYGKEVWADWFGAKPAPPPGALVPSGGTPVAPEPTTSSGYAWRIYEIGDPNVKQMVDEIQQYFSTHQYDRQLIPQEAVWIVQGRKAGGWRDWVGMGQTATVVIEPVGDGLKVSIGGAKWFDKGAGMATGFFTGGVTWVTSVVGIVQQQQLVDDLWLIVERFIKANGGRQLAFG
jgi:pSer/pThr/pTyr-binding forkhead associated (FHA) protein